MPRSVNGARCTTTLLGMDAASKKALLGMDTARAVLLGLLARGGEAAALVPDLVKDGLRASPDVATADPATLERVAAWLLASP